MKKRIFDIIQIGNKNDLISLLFDYIITIVIFLNLFVTFVLTFNLSDSFMNVMKIVELVTMIIFTVEYILRIWTAEYLYPNKSRIKSTLLFSISFYGLVDILTILPYWLPIETIYGMAVFRMIRVFRIFHLFKVNSQSDAYNVIISVLKEKKDQLLSSISIIAILMLSASFIMYSIEHQAQPEVFNNAFSGLWWSVSTVLTVGYGDIYPVTALGKSMAIVISILGVMITAIPTGILSAGFSEIYHKKKTSNTFKATEYMIRISKNNAWIGIPVKDIVEKYDIHVVSIIRNAEALSIDKAKVEKNDILICVGR